MGTAGRGSVLELWLLGPDVVVEPGEKLADTRAAEEDKERPEEDAGSLSWTLRVRWLSYTCSSRCC